MNGEKLWRRRDLLDQQDCVLELGAGLGFISTYVTKMCRPQTYIAVEADPRLLPHIAATRDANDVSGVIVLNNIVTTDEKVLKDGIVDFSQARSFWGSSADRDVRAASVVQVKTLSLREIIDQYGVTILLAHIERRGRF